MEQFRIQTQGAAPAQHTFIKGTLRLTALTPRLLRVEYHPSGKFCDKPTQIVWNRSFDSPQLSVTQTGGSLLASTPAVTFRIDSKGRVRSVVTTDGKALTQKGNLKGTRRTLDNTFGRAALEDGLLSRGGLTVLDDSGSLLLSPAGDIIPRENPGGSDKYYFAYGRDHRACLRDFYRLTGPVPLIPRWALGNWWSRYKAYTQGEYLALMERFRAENIPLTVATVDMDWHWVDLGRFEDTDKKRKGLWGAGWTGYSWNSELFPDYRAFLRRLHEMNLKVTLNLHPASGVRGYEDAYEAMAKAVGMDPASKQTVEFDLTDPTFRKAYFEVLHHPYEAEGVDFWWIDWQQGRQSRLPGLDPLWALNHYHFLDNCRGGKPGLTLSRYAGLGSHRYPLGFSGDTAINWKVLAFQPYFTANAANAGYGWWSHDIGGHHIGRKDDELFLRWVQLGVFNPIMRLHSTSNAFGGKEPWLCDAQTNHLTAEYMRLRHRLIPYIYSMSMRARREGAALCEPLYYQYPDEPGAYRHRNSYFFGSELLVAPITEPCDPRSRRASTQVWLPPGRWTDIFTGMIYQGGRAYTLWRGAQHIPVFAKEGAILPMAPPPEKGSNDWSSPGTLHVEVWRGNGSFTLFEDEGETRFTVSEEGRRLRFTISPGRQRSYAIHFRDIQAEPMELTDTDGAEITLEEIIPLGNKDTAEALTECISSFQIGNMRKVTVYGKFIQGPGKRIPGQRRFKGCLKEILEL